MRCILQILLLCNQAQRTYSLSEVVQSENPNHQHDLPAAKAALGVADMLKSPRDQPSEEKSCGSAEIPETKSDDLFCSSVVLAGDEHKSRKDDRFKDTTDGSGCQ